MQNWVSKVEGLKQFPKSKLMRKNRKFNQILNFWKKNKTMYCTVILQNKRKTNFFSKASGLKFFWKIFSSEISKFDEKIFPKNIFQKFLKCWPYIENCQIFILGKKHVICILRRFSKIKNHKFGSISSNSDADKLISIEM